jgi:hypothetical protein
VNADDLAPETRAAWLALADGGGGRDDVRLVARQQGELLFDVTMRTAAADASRVSAAALPCRASAPRAGSVRRGCR